MDAQRREDAHIMLDLLLDTVTKVEEKRDFFDRIRPGDRAAALDAERALQFYEQRRAELEEELEACIAGDEYELPDVLKRKKRERKREAAEQEELDAEHSEPEKPALPQDFAAWWRMHNI